ncbi:SacI homology domain-containing protein [Mortierella sp. GBAus27b]|nr:hypothetical protein BGX31_008497 [Mortierella sp. GBA43]KAI8362890.1 SacI homology domain-containing protein [Mortierella sp. GBAus27b]
MQPGPYARILLTVEPDRFILQPFGEDLPDNDKSNTGPEQLLQILFKTQSEEGLETEEAQKTAQELDGDKLHAIPPAPVSLLGHTEEHQHRVSFITRALYDRTADARAYIIYGCIGLLDLHTGPHFIVITSVKALGEIEDKPVYAINKVAVLPMDTDGAHQVLDKLARGGPTKQIEQDSELQIVATKATAEEELQKESAAHAAVRSPKVRFSPLPPKDDSSPSSSPSLQPVSDDKEPGRGEAKGAAEVVPPKPKRISFDFARFYQGNKSNSSLLSSTTPNPETSEAEGAAPLSPSLSPVGSPKPSSQSGFFTKLKGNMLEKKTKRSMEGSSIASNSGSTAVANASEKPSQEGSLPTVPPTPKVDTSANQAAKGPTSPNPTPKSPSALAAAERFVIDSTKQLASWSEEAMSGLLGSSTVVETTEECDCDTAINSSTDNRIAEEELEKDKILDRRIIREISSILSTGFYFATDFNLLSSKQSRLELAKDGSKGNTLLWQQVDTRFWWNEHLLQEFLDIKANGYILPIMQGYVEVEECVIEDQPFEFTLISRRSRERSGLRYQRRGIDDEGHTANFVETEQLLRIVRGDSDHQVSFVQTRGSIPLFWSQSPYRLKPIPILERSEQENLEGFTKHMESQIEKYGQLICISLVETRGREMIAGSAYTRYIEKLSDPQVKYVQFDFHEQCRGMKYENIEKLIKSLETPISELGYCWITPNSNGPTKDKDTLQRLNQQKGVIRTNCMDCLDRTNVVQSAIGRYVLNHQLLRLGIASFPDQGLSVYEDFENIFNNVWANNGDAISREYAGTSALKGDFTRTGKRNLQGMINDATNSMARMYQNTFKDYFRQAAIDYLLGAGDMAVFKKLQTTVFGTAVVPNAAVPPVDPTSQEATASTTAELSPASSLDTDQNAAVKSVDLAGSLPSSQPPSTLLNILPSVTDEPMSTPGDDSALQQEAWLRIREAAIETSAEIVISPGEERWKGWTFICCNNEINSSLNSASSPLSLTAQGKKPERSSPLNASVTATKSQTGDAPVFYDEKVVLLTERALYICTYDYEMEKVREFWRLALEKIVGIDKGPFFLTAQDTSRHGQDPLENYGFAVVYRANSEGETLRVNRGSVRNRRKMGVDRALTEEVFNLDRVPEVDEESDVVLDAQQPSSGLNDSQSAKQTATEPSQTRSVRFKIVKHPKTSMVPYATLSEVDPTVDEANPTRYRRTCQDCVEWVVTEIVQARCELVSKAEKGVTIEASDKSSKEQLLIVGGHDRCPSEEYNYQAAPSSCCQSVQVDLVIQDKVLQSLEVAAQLEKDALKREQGRTKKPKRPFSALFFSTKPVKESETPSPNNSVSWLKRFQFGQDTDSETEDEEVITEEDLTPAAAATAIAAPAVKSGDSTDASQPNAKANQGPSSDARKSSGMFSKLKQAVKNF